MFWANNGQRPRPVFFNHPSLDPAAGLVLTWGVRTKTMKRTIVNGILAGGVSALTAISSPAASTPVTAATPLVEEWKGPFGGLPPFDQVKVEQFKPAFELTMEQYRADIKAIAENADAPTFQNTIAALEGAGRPFARVASVYGVWSSTMATPDFQAVERDMEPRLAALRDEITQNEKLFQRIEAVYQSPDKEKLNSEQQRLVWYHYTEFVRSGAKLDAAGKTRVASINQRLADLYTRFGQNLLSDEEGYATILSSEADLAGLPESFRTGAAVEAKSRGLTNQWVIANTRSSAEPFMTYSSRRDLREKVWRNFVSRGEHAGERDNQPLISEILKLRAERASLLGYSTHAHWRLENSMAHTPERAMELMEAVWKPAIARVREEVADMQQIADKEGAKIRIEPWDYRYYAEKVRKAKYDLDQNSVKPYLQLEKLREGMFWAVGQLYGFTFTPVASVPVYHPDVRVWEVKEANGRHVGLFYFDPYARPGKRSGAWASDYRCQERFEREITVLVSNNCNFMKGSPGEPVLISWDDADTLFHEFGHALHALCSDVTYPTLAGTAVARDFVELPSQINEHWLSTPEMLKRYATHYQTGVPIPQSMVERIQKAGNFNQGFSTTEFLASALIDMKLHLVGSQTIDPAKFEKDELGKLGMPSEIVMRHRIPQFAHIFSSESYSAGYYSYLWADTLTADAAEAFKEGRGFYDKTVAAKFRAHILSRGNSIDPTVTYRNFRGRDAGIEALMRKRGFPIESKPQ